MYQFQNLNVPNKIKKKTSNKCISTAALLLTTDRFLLLNHALNMRSQCKRYV